MPFQLKHLALALLVVAIWGFNFVVIKLGVAAVPPLLLTGLRFTFAALPAVFFVARPTAPLHFVAAYGIMLGVIKFGLLFVAMHIGFSASLSSLVLQLQAFFTIGFAAIVLHERPKPSQLAGAALAFSGIAIIAATRWSAQALLPMILAIIAAAAWGVANIISKASGEKNALSFIIWSSLFSPLPLFALSWATEDHAEIIRVLTHPSWTAIGATLFLAWVSTLLGFTIWNNLLSRYSAASVAPFSLLVPVFGIASGVLLLGDQFGPLLIVGSVLVFAGLALNVFGPRLLRADPAKA